VPPPSVLQIFCSCRIWFGIFKGKWRGVKVPLSYNSDTLYIIIGGAYSLALFFSFLLFSYLPLVPIVPLSLGLAFHSNSPPPALLQFLFLSLGSSLGVTLFTATANALFSCVPSIPCPVSLIFLLNSFYFIYSLAGAHPAALPPLPNQAGSPVLW